MKVFSWILFIVYCLHAFALADESVRLDESEHNALASVISVQVVQPTAPAGTAEAQTVVNAARNEMIDRIIELAERMYIDADGQPQRAKYSSDVYICKNFSVFLFKEVAKRFCMAAYPDVPLVIPANLPRESCWPHAYGFAWKNVSAEAGNPFRVAAQFLYNAGLTKEENQQLARAFMQRVQRGDYFQMAANYCYGVGPHSLIFIADYSPHTDSVRWTDSNMLGQTVDDIRYGYVQYDAAEDIDWFVDAFCKDGYGATLYRLRDDIIHKP